MSLENWGKKQKGGNRWHTQYMCVSYTVWFLSSDVMCPPVQTVVIIRCHHMFAVWPAGAERLIGWPGCAEWAEPQPDAGRHCSTTHATSKSLLGWRLCPNSGGLQVRPESCTVHLCLSGKIRELKIGLWKTAKTSSFSWQFIGQR